MYNSVIRISEDIKSYTKEEYANMIVGMFSDLFTNTSMKRLYRRFNKKVK